MSEENKAIVRRFIEEVDNGNLERAIEFLAPDFVAYQPQGQMDREELMRLAGGGRAAFPDFRHTIEDQIAEGDRVVTRLTNHGTHKGDFQGIAPTGKRVTVTEIAINRLAEGKIIEHRAELDILGLMQQLGAIPVN